MEVINKSKKVEVFQPVVIELTLEKTEEVVAFYMLLNHTALALATGIQGVLDLDAIRSALGRVNYEPFWQKFSDSLGKYFYGTK